MLFNVLNNVILNCPFKKIKLPDGGLYRTTVLVWEINTVPSAKGVEPFFRIRFQFQLVIRIHLEPPIGLIGSIGAYIINGIVFFRIISGKPVNNPKRNNRLAVNNCEHFSNAFEIILTIKLYQIVQQ